jgi:hypothetical protein
VLDMLRRAYPGGRSADVPLEDLLTGGLDLDTCAGLPARIVDLLPARVIGVRAEPDGLGDVLYVLAGIHAPCLLELREGRCPRDAPMLRTRETYLRVPLSPFGRFAALQESVLEVGDLGGDARIVVETPRVGVEDRDLRPFVTALQAMLRRDRIALLDFTFLMQPFDDGHGAGEAFAARWATRPTIWSVLFDPAPPTTTREVVV